MLVNKLSKLTGINIETIRLYRNKGLLKPKKNPKNGYYHYSDKDVFVLNHIQLLRMQNISLNDIYNIFQSSNTIEIQNHLDSQINEIIKEIDQLNKKLNTLLTTYSHIKETPQYKKVDLIHINDKKYDYYEKKQIKNIKNLCINSLIPFSIAISFDATILNDDLNNSLIPIETGIGIYNKDFKNANIINIPPNYTIIPSGNYIITLIKLKNLKNIDTNQLLPIKEYAKKHQLLFTGVTTSFITHIDYCKDKPVFHLRLRAQVIKK